jgi:hypothetical protein
MSTNLAWSFTARTIRNNYGVTIMDYLKEADIRRFLTNCGFKLKDLKQVINKMIEENKQ